MNLNELRDKAYRNAVTHGFHDEELSNEHCLCLVISELMEAVKADRKGRFAKVPVDKKGTIFDERTFHYHNKYFAENFETYIKDCVEDELADACIRLLDLAGLRNISIDDFSGEMIYEATESCNNETFTESIYAISTIPIRCEYEYDSLLENQLNSMLLAIFGFAKHLNIDLIWHVEQKMRYYELRENKHGKSIEYET